MNNVVFILMVGMEILLCCNRVGASKTVVTRCEDLKCENDNPCRTTVSQDSKDDTRVECFCQGRWTGRRCELELLLKASVLTVNSVKIDVFARTPHSGKRSVDSPSKYTLMYWNNSTERACLMVQELASTSTVVAGLVPAMHYTFCSETGAVEFCEMTRYNIKLPSNCVTAFTSDSNQDAGDVTMMGIGVSLAVVFCLLLVMVVVSIILVRKQHCLPLSVVLDSCKCVLCQKRNKDSRNAQNNVLLPEPPIYRGPRRQELSPSKTDPRLSTRAKSYGEISEPTKTLTTLLEETEEVVNIGETSLTEPLTTQSV